MMNTSMNDYRIEKLRRAVTVVLSDGRRLDGDIFLQARARFRPGPEEPVDLLNDDDPYFPLSCAGRDLLLIAKDQVSLVEASVPGSDVADEPLVGMDVEIWLADGNAVCGSVFPETRSDRPRLLDFLNTFSARFLAVFAADRVSLVNRRLIAHVRELT